MKILEIRGVNAFGLREFEFKPNGKSVVFKGRNGTGKSSLVRSVEACVAGAKDDLKNITFVHGNGDNTELLLVLGDTDVREWELEREWDSDGKARPGRFVLRHEGQKVENPSRVLASIVRSIHLLNPIRLYLADARERRDMFLRAIPVGFDTAENFRSMLETALMRSGAIKPGAKPYDYSFIEGLVRKLDPDFETVHALFVCAELRHRAETIRKDTGQIREQKIAALTAAIGDAKRPEYDADKHEDAQMFATDAGTVEQSVRDANDALVRAQAAAGASRDRIADFEERIAELQRKLDAEKVNSARADSNVIEAQQFLDAAKDAVTAEYDSIRAWMPEGPFDGSVQLTQLWGRVLSNFEVQRQRVADFDTQQERGQRVREDIARTEALYSFADDAVTVFRDALPQLVIANVDMPVPGITVSEEGILVDGVPIEQRSEGERLMFALQMAERLLRGGEEKLDTMLIDGIEKIDPEKLEIVESYAKDNRIQLIMTKVDRGELRMEEVADGDQ